MANKETLTQLVKSARSGNTQAINKLFESCYNDIYYFALKTVKNEDTAYDITQEACIEIFNGLPSLENESAFTTWSRQIAYRRCCRYFEKNRDVLVDEGDEENNIFDSVEDSDMDFIPDEALDREDFRKTIMDMINALSEEQRTAVMLYYFDELSVGEIAQIQGVSEGTVKSRLNYARKSIKSAVEDYEEKNNIKLHSFGLLPLLLWLRGGDMAGLSIPTASAGLQSAISALTSVGASATAATAATVTATSAPPFVATAATAATKAIGLKIVAVVAAAAISITGSVLAVKTIVDKVSENNASVEEKATTTLTEQGSSQNKPNSENKPDEDDEVQIKERIPDVILDDYSSDVLKQYIISDEINSSFVKCLDPLGFYYATDSGDVYSKSYDDEYITNVNLNDVYFMGGVYKNIPGGPYYVDGDTLYCLDPFNARPNISYKIHIGKPHFIYENTHMNSWDLITVTEDNKYYYNNADCARPIKFIDNQSGTEIKNIEYFHGWDENDDFIYHFIVIADGKVYTVETNDLIPNGTEYVQTYLKFYNDRVEMILCSTSLTIDRMLYSEVNSGISMIFSVKGDSKNIYYDSNRSVKLPDGYTTKDIEKVFPGTNTFVTSFTDGSVYLLSTDNSPIRIDDLCSLYEEGHIKEFYLLNSYYIYSTGEQKPYCSIKVLMANGKLYEYTKRY